MRQIQAIVPGERYESVATRLDEEEIDFVRQRAWMDGEEVVLVRFPLPTDAIGYVLGALEEAGLDPDRYTVIGAVEAASTRRMEGLRSRFASDFDPLTPMELRSKAHDMSRDMRSFLAMVLLSAVIATAGLLQGSPAVVVGSMVIAPIVGPVLTAAVGGTTGDTRMFADSVWYQLAGIATAIVGAFAFSLVLQTGGFMPRSLDITSLDLIAVRIAPGMLTLTVGLAAGGAAAYGLATKGPTSLIGVMIAAALIPAAGTVGIAGAWSHPRIAVGSLLLVLVTLILINVGATTVLWRVGYGTPGVDLTLPCGRPVAVALVVVLALSIAVTAGAALDQTGYERATAGDVGDIVDRSEHDAFDLVAVRTQYQGGGFEEPTTVTVHVSQSGQGDPGELATDLRERLGERTELRLQVIAYE